jgi:hypothetical protein
MNEQASSISGGDRMSRFERVVVFRVARGYFLFMAVIAVLTFIGGVVVGTRGFLKTAIAQPAPPTAPSARAPLTYAAVQEQIAREAERAKNEGATIAFEEKDQPSHGGTPSHDPLQDELDKLIKTLQAQFPDPPYAWTNQMERVCVSQTAFGCLQYDNRIKKIGVVGTIGTALKGLDKNAIVKYLAVLARVLDQVPVDRRLEMIIPIVQAEKEAQASQEKIEREHQERVDEIDRKYKEAVRENDAEHEGWKMMGIYGLATGFGLLIVVSLFLAFLSMERHTRVLEKLVAGSLQEGRRYRE